MSIPGMKRMQVSITGKRHQLQDIGLLQAVSNDFWCFEQIVDTHQALEAQMIS